MKQIVLIAWKCIKNPRAGGAEVVHQEISRRLVKDGYKVIHLVPGFKGASEYEEIDGIHVYRAGKSLLSFYKLVFIYIQKFKNSTDILVDVFNCFGSFSSFFARKSTKRLMFIHHIQAEIWHHQAMFPFVKPFNLVGKFIENLQLRIYSLFLKGQVVTVSDSTKNELTSYGFKADNIDVIKAGSDIEHVEKVNFADKYPVFTVLFVGRLEGMKRPMDAVMAFKLFADKNPESQMIIIGSGDQKEEIEKYIKDRGIKNIYFKGRVSQKDKKEIMKKSHVILATSVKEGWGLIVTEANSQGTPAVTYNVGGLIDSNKKGVTTGVSTQALADGIEQLYLDHDLYKKISLESWKHSAQFTFDLSYKDFKEVLEN
jgi:glycosyltransferase involved in cell wall biosynthesis